MPETERLGSLPDCPHCGHPADESLLGNIGRLGIFDCVSCAKRFYVEEIPGHNCATALGREKQQYRPRRKEVA